MYANDFQQYFPVFYTGADTTTIPPYSCMAIDQIDTTLGPVKNNHGVQLLVTKPTTQTLCNPNILLFNGPHRIRGAGRANITETLEYAVGAGTFSEFFLACNGTNAVTYNDLCGPDSNGLLTDSPEWSAPFLCIKPGNPGLFRRMHHPDGVFAITGHTASSIAASGLVDMNIAGHSRRTTYTSGTKKLTLNVTGVWDVHFSATLYGDTGAARGDSLVIAMESSGGTVVKGSALRLHDKQADGYDPDLTTKENIAFTSHISCQAATDIWFYNASSVAVNLERICVTVRQVSFYRYPLS